MSGATASLLIFAQIGVQPLPIWTCLITLSVTLLSILLFRVLKIHEKNHLDLTHLNPAR
jgi:hypothetical protein